MTIIKTPMNWILERTGITTSWLVQQLGYGVGTLDYAINERGLNPTEINNIQQILNLAGQQLKTFKFSKDAYSDILEIRTRFGIKKKTWADALKVPETNLNAILKRQAGLTPEELEILELTKKSIANDLISFKFPRLKKAA